MTEPSLEQRVRSALLYPVVLGDYAMQAVVRDLWAGYQTLDAVNDDLRARVGELEARLAVPTIEAVQRSAAYLRNHLSGNFSSEIVDQEELHDIAALIERQQRQIVELESERKVLRAAMGSMARQGLDQQRKIAELESLELEADARRYRWLRDNSDAVDWQYVLPEVPIVVFRVPNDVRIAGSALDKVIDAAIKVSAPQGWGPPGPIADGG